MWETVLRGRGRYKPVNATLKIEKRPRLPVRKDRIRELVAAGFDERVLTTLLAAFLNASKERKAPLSRMKNRELLGLAGRVCRLATEIKTLNAEVSRSSGLPVSDLAGAALPVELALYGTWLLALTRMPWAARASDRQLIKLLLIAVARKLTGNSRYTALSELLTDSAAARKNESEEDVTPEALMQLAKDHELRLKEFESQLDTILAHVLQEPAH